MTPQAVNVINLCLRQPEGKVRMVLKNLRASVRDEIAEHYGGSFETAITHISLGTR